MANSVQVIEKNEGPKLAWSQKDSKLIFGDDDLAIRCDTRQRDYPVHVDICADDDGNLITGVGRYYIAQIDIPAAKYEEREAEQLSMAEMDGGAYKGMIQYCDSVGLRARLNEIYLHAKKAAAINEEVQICSK